MKLVEIAGLAFLVISVNTVPLEEVKNVQNQESTEVFGTEEIFLSDGLEDDTTIELDGDGTTPSLSFIEEVTEYYQQKIGLKKHNRVTRQTNEGILQHGSTIALQSVVRNQWVSCYSTYCNQSSCPRLYMTGEDWAKCWGEVFRIYRADGPGEVQVGDLVGIYYPHWSGRWLGCPGNQCGKHPCPGQASTAHGFATKEKWYRCWGEVFKIYAVNKGLGATINSGDEVAFYYLQNLNWVSLGQGNMVKSTCLGTVRPPSLSTYDGCASEVFRLWKK